MPGPVWRLVARRLRRHLPPARVEPVLVDLLDDYTARRRQQHSVRAAVWLIREARSLEVAYRAQARAHSTEEDWPGLAGQWTRRLRVDLRDAIRGLRNGGWTTLLAVAILAITMAAGTVTVSVVDAVALRPLPYGAPERLVGLGLPTTARVGLLPASPQDYFSWLEGTHTLESLGAARPTSPIQLELGGVSETLTARAISANLFDVLGIRPAVGRFFGPEHERPGGPTAVILSHELWVRRFGTKADVIGRHLPFDQGTREVIGVLPAGVSYPITLASPPDLYIPYVVTAANRSSSLCCMLVVGRLRRGVSVEQARADVNRVSVAVVLPLQDQVVGPAKRWLLLVLAAVGFVLLVACVNVANLLLARSTVRARELATREALGASRRRLAAGLLLEGLLLALASAAAALVASVWGVEIAKSRLPPGLTRISDIAINGRVLVVSISAAVMCGLVSTSAPAWLAVRSDLLGLMKTSGGPIIGGRRRDRSLSAFLVANVAFVCMLLVATALVVTSFILVTTAELGFDRHDVMTIGFQHSLKGVAEADQPAAAAALRGDLLERAMAVPGVGAVAIYTGGSAPLSGGHVRYSITIPGVGETKDDDILEANMVTPDYFRVMGMQLVRGRVFQPADRAGAPQVMLINDVAARRFFRDRDPIGQVVMFRGPTTIIGVLHGVRFDGPEAEVQPAMYTPADQEPSRYAFATTTGALVVRTTRDARGLAATVREAIRPALIGQEPSQPRFAEDSFRRLTADRRFNADLMAGFGLIALAIGAIGVYGTMSFVVARQVRAIGVRMALGASPSRILRSVIRDALRRVGLGVAIGLAGAWALSSAFTAFVFGIRPTDPTVYIAVGGFLALVGLAAALVPARRAARLDPLRALGRE